MNRGDAMSAEVGGERIRVLREVDPVLNELAFEVIGAAMEVHRCLGPGYLESGYEAAMALEMTSRGLPFERQKTIAVSYKDRPVGEGRLDFLVAERLVVELKAIEGFAPIHRAQVISYLKATGLHLGLINFKVPLLKDGLQRVILS